MMVVVLLLSYAFCASALSWTSLEGRLKPAAQASNKRNTVFYRDTNGWCPFCERSWLALEHTSTPYKEELVDLKNKPQWYKDKVPTALVPAIEFDITPQEAAKLQGAPYLNCTALSADGKSAVVWDSKAVLHAIDDFLAHPLDPLDPLDPAGFSIFAGEGSALYASACSATEKVQSAGLRFTYSAQATDQERAERREGFENALAELDTFLGSHAGPFLAGALSAVDMMIIPSLERYRFQLPYSKQLDVYDVGRYPSLAGWFDHMDALPAYRRRVRGDAISWLATVSVFQRLFSPKDEEGNVSPEVMQTIREADAKVGLLLEGARLTCVDHVGAEARQAAARVLVRNHEAIVRDICNPAPKSQTHLLRLSEGDMPLIDEALQVVCSRLISSSGSSGTDDASSGSSGTDDASISDTGGAWSPSQRETVRQGLLYLAQRVCAPRDMGSDSAAVLRAVLLQL